LASVQDMNDLAIHFLLYHADKDEIARTRNTVLIHLPCQSIKKLYKIIFFFCKHYIIQKTFVFLQREIYKNNRGNNGKVQFNREKAKNTSLQVIA